MMNVTGETKYELTLSALVTWVVHQHNITTMQSTNVDTHKGRAWNKDQTGNRQYYCTKKNYNQLLVIQQGKAEEWGTSERKKHGSVDLHEPHPGPTKSIYLKVDHEKKKHLNASLCDRRRVKRQRLYSCRLNDSQPSLRVPWANLGFVWCSENQNELRS